MGQQGFHNHQRHSVPDAKMGRSPRWLTSAQRSVEKRLAARKRRQRDRQAT